MSFVAKRRITVLASLISVLLVAGVAFAAWTANGSGSGSAQAGTSAALTTDAYATTADALIPGGSGDVTLKILNSNAFPVAVSAINANGAVTSNDASCTVSGVSFANQSAPTEGWTVPANGHLNVKLADAASMSNASQNACQGDTFTIPVTILGQSAAS